MKNINDIIDNEFFKTNNNKELSAGVIIKCPSGILMCHPTGKTFKKNNWDLPKGHIERDETPIETAVREVYEETGLCLDKTKLKDLGEFNYISYKNLHLFIIYMDNDIDTKNLKCISNFTDDKDILKLEMDYYMLSNDFSMLYKSYEKIFKILKNKNII